MIFAFLGEIAALGTSVCWSATASFFSVAARRVGSVTVNRTRLALAVGLLAATHWAIRGSLIPLSAEPSRWFWLGLSGVVGLVLGDACLFQAFIWIGPRIGMLMMSLAPIIAALLALFFLGENLVPMQWLAIVITLAGVAMVVLDRQRPEPAAGEKPNFARGILFGLGAAAGQATGLVLAKRGLEGEYDALSGVLIRMLVAFVVIWILAVLLRQAGETLQRVRSERDVILPLLGGAVTGPYIGVWLSLIAVQRTEVGIASTLMALPPVFLLPIGRFIFKESIGLQAIVGTLVAVGGVALLFLIG
jgi:drug/metabolite transporter (DMT)-like permease